VCNRFLIGEMTCRSYSGMLSPSRTSTEEHYIHIVRRGTRVNHWWSIGRAINTFLKPLPSDAESFGTFSLLFEIAKTTEQIRKPPTTESKGGRHPCNNLHQPCDRVGWMSLFGSVRLRQTGDRVARGGSYRSSQGNSFRLRGLHKFS
jgi:hypothetical protein